MSIPLSLTGTYQLVVLGEAKDARVIERTVMLLGSVRAAFKALGVSSRFLVASTPTDRVVLDPKMVTVAVFFASVSPPSITSDDKQLIDRLLSNGALVVPVVDDLDKFSNVVPKQIGHLNGSTLADCGENFERLAAKVLEGFGLLRVKRRLFISYRRVETSGVATQLYEALDAAGFDVFLDTHSVGKGEPFQEVLWHRLADTDVALLLDSPDFLESRWGEEELARANTSNIQILQLLWPDRTEAATAALSTFHPLKDGDFVGIDTLGPHAQLVEASVNEIVDAVEGLRARAIAARHSFLVRQFVKDAASQNVKVLTTLELSLVARSPKGREMLIVPAIGVPDAEGYEGLERLHRRDVGEGRAYAIPPVLLYDETGIRNRWLEHLGWLNDNISAVRSLSIVNARSWLSDFVAGDAP